MARRSRPRPEPLPIEQGSGFSMPETIARTITLNGDQFPVDGDFQLIALLERLGMRPNRVAVELNREIVPKAKYPQTIVRAGDHVEIINFVGGG